MKELGKILKCKEVSLETQAKVTHTRLFPITMYECESWTVKKTETGRAAMKELGKIIKYKEVSLETKANIIHTFIFPITMYGCGSWTVEKVDWKKLIHLKYCAGGEL